MSCSSKKSCCEKQNCSASPSSEPMPIFRRMENLIEEELAFVEVEKQRGRKLVGIYCEYTPRELILAADAIPVCLCGFDQEMATAAESRLPTNLCPLIKSSFGYIETHSCPFFEQADAIVAETTCDGKKKMYELIAERHPTFVLELTQKPDEARAFAHWLEEVRALKIFLEKTLETTITNAALSEAIRKMNRRRERLLKIAEYAQGPEIYIRGLENLLLHFRLADAGMEEECLTAVEAELERRHKAKETVAPKNAPRILITGVPVGHDVAKVFRLVEECGAAVVVQESCTGLKPLYENVAETGDPLEAIARKYFHLPCSCFTPNAERFHLLDKLTADFKVDGVIDLIWQACHTYNVESTRVREWAAGKHLPFLKIETDYSPSDTERLKTRIETFLELIR